MDADPERELAAAIASGDAVLFTHRIHWIRATAFEIAERVLGA
jgi:hypothetical protein